MDFREATDGLFAKVDHQDLARALGVSVASIRQARLKPEAQAHRTAPEDWEAAVIRLAEERAGHYRRLIEQLRDLDESNPRESAAAHEKRRSHKHLTSAAALSGADRGH